MALLSPTRLTRRQREIDNTSTITGCILAPTVVPAYWLEVKNGLLGGALYVWVSLGKLQWSVHFIIYPVSRCGNFVGSEIAPRVV